MTLIRKYLDLSTSHLDAQSQAMLDAATADTLVEMGIEGRLPEGMHILCAKADPLARPGALLVYPSRTGWICYAHDDADALSDAGVTDVIIHIFKYARDHGCEYVLFDSNTATDYALPTFDAEDVD